MYESLQILTAFTLTFMIDIIYGTIVNLLARALREHLGKEMPGLLQAGLALIGLVDLAGGSATTVEEAEKVVRKKLSTPIEELEKPREIAHERISVITNPLRKMLISQKGERWELRAHTNIKQFSVRPDGGAPLRN